MEIDQYLQNIPENRIERFKSLLKFVMSLYPNASLSMKYKMPTFTEGEGWVAIANQKNYISLYTCGAQHLTNFKSKHPEIKTGKGCINFLDKNEMPLNDLKSVIKSAMDASHHH